jgi:dUTP pyrophosphatase
MKCELFKMYEDVEEPAYSTQYAAGFDIKAYLKNTDVRMYNRANEVSMVYCDGSFVLPPHTRALVPTGLIIKIPENYEVQIRSRSGMSVKYGIIVLNQPGTIDSDYVDEWKVILVNTSNVNFTINHGDRIAQGVLAKHECAWFDLLNQKPDKVGNREGGMGSTGV